MKRLILKLNFWFVIELDGVERSCWIRCGVGIGLDKSVNRIEERVRS